MSTHQQLTGSIFIKLPPRKLITRHLSTTSRSILPAWLICLQPLPLWLGAAVFDNDMLGSLGALLGTWLTIIWWYRLLKQPHKIINLLKMGGISLALILSLSWLIAFYSNVISLDRSISQALQYEVGTTTSDYALAVAYALCIASVLAAMGELPLIKKLEGLAVTQLLSFRSLPLPRLLALILGIATLEMMLIITNVISYRGYAIEGFDLGVIPWYIPMLELLFALHILLNGLALSQFLHNRKNSLIVIGIVLASCFIVLFIYFTKGRAALISCVVLHFIWLCFFYGNLPKLKLIIPAVVIIIPIILIGSMLNNFMRGAESGLTDVRSVGIATVMGEAIDTFFNDKSIQENESERSADNLSTRPLVANPLAKAMALEPEKKEFMLGENLLNSFIWALPSVIYSDKSNVKVQEDLYYQYFPIGTQDTADSIYLYAYMDFSFVGFIIYPLVITALWAISLWIASLRVMPSFVIMIFISGWIPLFSLNIGEWGMIGWFGNLRNLIIMLFICIPLVRLFSIIQRIKIWG